MPGVVIGQVDPVSQGPWAGYLYTSPSFTWDPRGARLLVVHGDEDVISEVDIETGEVIEHPVAGTFDLPVGNQTSEHFESRWPAPLRGHSLTWN